MSFVALALPALLAVTPAATAPASKPGEAVAKPEVPAGKPAEPTAQGTPLPPNPDTAAPGPSPEGAAATEPAKIAAPPAPPEAPPAPPPPPPEPIDVRTPPPPPALNRTRHTHDGFYLRLGLGLTAFSDTVVVDGQHRDSTFRPSIINGLGSASEIAIGGTLGKGVVLGGGFYNIGLFTSGLRQGDGPDVPAELKHPDGLALVALFVDWWIKPHAGVHLQGALGLASLTGLEPERGRVRDENAPVGGGVMLGFGNEWWVGDDWGMGILGRLTGAVIPQQDDSGVRWIHTVAAAPSLLFTATYH